MKKTWYMVLGLFPAFVLAQSATTFDAKMQLGKLLADGKCDEHMRGSCGTTFSALNSDSGANGVVVKTGANTITLKLSRALLSETEQISIAGKAFNNITANETVYFLMPQDLSIDTTSLRNIGIDPAYNIVKAGQYSLRVTTDTAQIDLVLSAK